jgi:hypothetical protein
MMIYQDTPRFVSPLLTFRADLNTASPKTEESERN